VVGKSGIGDCIAGAGVGTKAGGSVADCGVGAKNNEYKSPAIVDTFDEGGLASEADMTVTDMLLFSLMATSLTLPYPQRS